MGVKVRERTLASGEITFHIDTYHKDYGRFSQKTGIEANSKNRKEYKEALAVVQEKVRQIEKDLEFDPAALFGRKAKSAEDFTEFFRAAIMSNNYPQQKNTLVHIKAFAGGPVSFDKLNSGWLERFKSYLLAQKQLSKNTASGYFSLSKSIIRQAWRAGYLQEDFTGKVQGIRKTDIGRNFLTLDQIDALNQAKCDNLMVKQAFLFSCFSGLRISDTEALEWDQVSLINGAPFIRFQQKKTGQHENIPLSEQAVKIIQEVRELHADYVVGDSKKVFLMPMSRERTGDYLRVWGERAGLTWKLHYHVSRHTFATLNLIAGNDLYTVSKLLGHKEIKTTQIYSRIIDAAKSKAVSMLPMLSPTVIASIPKQILHPQPALALQPVSAITQTLTTKGETIANALGLKKNQQGNYEFEGKQYTPIDLALEVAGNNT